jgi:hypothetical protein
MTSPAWNDDERLLQELASALRTAQPLDAALRRAGEAAFSWHAFEEELELAGLVYDSVLETSSPSRGPDVENYRTVLFEAPSVSVQLERNGDVVVGQVMPPGPGRLTLEGGHGCCAPIEVDEVGCFCLENMPAGPIRLRWDGEAVHLVTSWMRF